MGSPSPKRQKSDQLQALKQVTSVVADTGDIEKIKQFRPEDATTNPTLLLQAVQMPEYKTTVTAAVEKAKGSKLTGESLVEEVCDQLAVAFGCEILEVVPGYVSTEVDANLSFDTNKSLEKARKIIRMYEERGYAKERILIKLASTWECIQACEALQKEGIRCNMTLLFGFAQAVACAEAGATLISPFVGRILDWYKKANPDKDYVTDPEQDPGVQSVKKIYSYYKQHGHKTIVMGASFRSKGEILALAGCDKLTIGPKFLAELEAAHEPVKQKLGLDMDYEKVPRVEMNEATFRWMLNEDAMATEKLSEGIRNFNKDLVKLKDLIRSTLL